MQCAQHSVFQAVFMLQCALVQPWGLCSIGPILLLLQLLLDVEWGAGARRVQEAAPQSESRRHNRSSKQRRRNQFSAWLHLPRSALLISDCPAHFHQPAENLTSLEREP